MSFPDCGTVWWVESHDVIVDRALKILRFEAGDPDYERVSTAANTAGEMIDQRLDRCTPLPAWTPEPILTAAVEATVTLYRRKDAPLGTAGGWADMIAVGSDPLEGVYAMIDPYRERWGVA